MKVSVPVHCAYLEEEEEEEQEDREVRHPLDERLKHLLLIGPAGEDVHATLWSTTGRSPIVHGSAM